MSEPTEMPSDRKGDHLRIAAYDERTQQPGPGNGLEHLSFEALSLPELDLEQVSTACTILGKTLKAPLLVGAMTGGNALAGQLNRILAEAAERCGVGFCLGSQRPMLDLHDSSIASFAVRDVAPTTLIFGNIGAIQLRDHLSGQDLDRLARAVGADAMMVHLNPLQEAIQPEGDRDWRGIHDALAEVAASSGTPIVIKEVGMGLGAQTLRRLRTLGIAGVETAGVGGTSWARIESLRHLERTPRSIAGEVLAGYGTGTAASIQLAREAMQNRLVIGSGGLRTGLDVARGIALGADACAMAWPFLKAAHQGVDAVVTEIQGVIETLRIVMFLAGAPDLHQLARTQLVDHGLRSL